MARPSLFNRQFFIKKRFQRKFILLYALSVSGVVGLATYLLSLQIRTAVEKHLYTTHIRINQVGDFLVDLLFKANFYAISAIIITILIISLAVFRRINRNFTRMEETISAMSMGNFSIPYSAGRSFVEIGNLASLLEKTRVKNQHKFEQIRIALDELEQGSTGTGDLKSLKDGKKKLDEALSAISLL